MTNDFEAYCEITKRACLASTLVFTKKMFWAMNQHEYIVGGHHRLICNALDDVVKGNITKLIINIAPRYGKTLLVSQMFQAYGMAVNPESKFIHLSYSGGLTLDNSVAVRDIVQSEFFQTLFEARVKFGSAQKAKWDTIQGGGLYATSTLGQITGFGAGVTEKSDEEIMLDTYSAIYNPGRFAGAIVIDDPIKPDDALSEAMREAVNRRFENTIRNRVNSRRTPIVIIMQRVHEHDLCGYLHEVEPDDWTVLSLPCLTIDNEGNEHALWEHKHTVDELHHLREVSEYVFETQYQQNPTPMEGLMYREFKTYDDLPVDGVNKCYCDTADTGADFLCAIFYREWKGLCYVTDVLYTKKPMEYTEPLMAEMCFRNDTTECVVESNNGGRGFMRNVERIARESGNSFTRFIPLTQTKNKEVRIFTQSNDVNNVVLFPKGWERAWKDYAIAMKTYRKEGKNPNDDAPDATTGVFERMDRSSLRKSGLYWG